jgi:beta-lactamase class A
LYTYILAPSDRDFALYSLNHVTSSQQYGVGAVAPTNASVAMKAGWVTDSNGLWTTGSVGIVSDGSLSYMIAVYSQGQSSADDGFAVLNKICGDVATVIMGKS